MTQLALKTPVSSWTKASTTTGPILQRKCACGVQAKVGGTCSECDEKQKMRLLQRKSTTGCEFEEVPSIVYDVLRSPGQPLDPETRAIMEPQFGQDFSKVRVHTDTTAAASSRLLDAHAYTLGNNIVFNSNKYSPRDPLGLGLLAHELTHVVQQSHLSDAVPSFLALAPSNDSLEMEAEQVASSTQRSLIAHDRGPTSQRIQRAISTLCITPFELFSMGGMPSAIATSSAFGTVAETLIEANYCSIMGCNVFATDYFDNPIPASYIAFLVANNPHLNSASTIAALALIGITGLNRPDILTHKPPRLEYYEIKPRSAAGIAEGITKLLTIQAFMASYSLPYAFGTAYSPTPAEILKGTVMVGPWPLTVSFRAVKIAPGLIVYDVCFEGELGKIAISALILILLFILTRGRIPGRIPVPAPAAIPLLTESSSRTKDSVGDTSEAVA